MKAYLALVALVLASCGDNSKECGSGTRDKDGVCIGEDACGPGTKLDTSSGECVPDGSMICTDGTVFDPMTSTCKLDPNACQGGTVLIGNQCVDPTGSDVVDVEEAPEPNGLGLFGETSNNPAGTIALKPVGEHFVLHGHITPFQDVDGDGLDDADIDSYVVTVAAPSLLHVTADGVHGLAAGFVAVDDVAQTDPLAAWVRFGINLTGDTSQRELFLPTAGTYLIAISDTRSLFLQGGAAGGPDAEYFVTIDALDMPAPTALPITGNTGTVTDKIGEDVVFYTAPMGTGVSDVLLDMPQVQANASVVTLSGTTFKGFADEGTDLFGNPAPAELIAGGFTAAETPIIAVDYTYNYAIAPADYTLTVTTSSAQPLSTTGGTVSETEQINSQPQSNSDVPLINQFYFDTDQADQTVGFKITWNHPVRGSLLDGNLDAIAAFTAYDSSAGTWTGYTGLLRIKTPGRYYFFVYDPAGTAGTTQLSATSTITMITPAAIAEGTPTGNTTLGTFGSVALTYDAGTTDPWQLFNATGVNTGGQLVGWYDPATTYGRLDTLTASTGAAAGEGVPVFQHPYTTAGGAIGRILLDDPTTNYFVKVNGVTPAPNATFNLSFARRAIIDLGTIAAADTASATNNPLGGATTTGYVLFRSQAGDPATITVHPHVVALNTRFRFVNADESFNGVAINTSNTGDDTTTLLPTTAWTAFEVTAVPNPPAAQQYDVTVAVATPTTYSDTAGTTAFANICGTAGAANIAFVADGTGNGPANDEGLSGVIAAPAGFKFYGVTSGPLRVSTNGWLTFGTPVDAAYTNIAMPNPTAPNGVVAPYWDDLANVTACRKTVGTRLTIQWNGVLFNTTTQVQFQAILDGATGTVELVWAAAQGALGDSATIGVEDPVGANATQHSYDMPGAITAGSSRLLTPM
jgi:hypothetical protein